MPRTPYIVSQCDGPGCGIVEHAPPGRMLPSSWRNTIDGLVLCGRCYERRLESIALRKGYPVVRP